MAVQWSAQYCDQSQSPFFRLPPELREQIYSSIFTLASPITDPKMPSIEEYGMRYCNGHTEIPPTGIGFLRTCRRIYGEDPTCFLYQKNQFRFTRCCLLAAFLPLLPERHAKQVRHISCDFRGNIAAFCPSFEVAGWIRYLSPHPQTLHPSSCRACGRLPQVPLQQQIHQLRSITFDIAEMHNIQQILLGILGDSPVNELGKEAYKDLIRFIGCLKSVPEDGVLLEWMRSLEEVQVAVVNSHGEEVTIRLEASEPVLMAWAKEQLEKLSRQATWHFLEDIGSGVEVVSRKKAEIAKSSKRRIEMIQEEVERNHSSDGLQFRAFPSQDG